LKTVTFGDVTISFQTDNDICIKTPAEEFTFNTVGRTIFRNQSGESAVELSGLVSEDARNDRSWAVAVYEKEGYSKLHYHEERTEIYYIISGTATITADGEERILMPGEEIMIYPNQQHQVTSSGEDELKMIVKCTPAWIVADQHFIEPSFAPGFSCC